MIRKLKDKAKLYISIDTVLNIFFKKRPLKNLMCLEISKKRLIVIIDFEKIGGILGCFFGSGSSGGFLGGISGPRTPPLKGGAS